MRNFRLATRLALLAACAWGGTSGGARASPSGMVSIMSNGGDLSTTLSALARSKGVDLLYDDKLVAGRSGRAVHGVMSTEEALRLLLVGTGIGFRVTADGAFVLFELSTSAQTGHSDEAIAEILVVGRKTQNADIRRSENDIQPYRVVTRDEIDDAHRDDVDDLLRTRETENAQISSASQQPLSANGSNQSEINLRGLGSGQTLILIDGRRMPGAPTIVSSGFLQPDLNAVPLGAIDRIETLPSTAGGIYGPGATGGVINIVLRRDFRGADLNVISGVTDRGDARRLRIEARLGFTPDDGRTDVMLFASRAIAGPLRTGDRDYLEDSRQRELTNDPAAYLARYPSGQGINVFSRAGDLSLSPALGGASLGAPVTSLPIDFNETAADRAAALLTDAGKIISTLPNDSSGARGDLLNRPTVTSGLLNVRHRFGETVEAYVDGLYFRNAGETVGRLPIASIAIQGGAPGNPFQQPVVLTYPIPVVPPASATVITTWRATVGLIATLSPSWHATAEFSEAGSTDHLAYQSLLPNSDFYRTIGSGRGSAGGLPALDPIGDWLGFIQALPRYLETSTLSSTRVDHSQEGSLRLAGTVFRLPGGPLTLTTTGGLRREEVPATALHYASDGIAIASPLPKLSQAVTTLYAELRAPLIASDAPVALLRELEFQLAVRYDDQKTTVPDDLIDLISDDTGRSATC